MLFLNDTLELRAPEPEDGAAILDVLSDPAVAGRLFGFPEKALSMSFESWLDAAALRKNDFIFSITQRQTGKALGLCAYQDIDYRNGRVTVWAALADAEYKALVLELLAQGAFTHLRAEHVAMHCLQGDTHTADAAKAAGFSQDAIFYSRVKKDGKNHDLSVYTRLKE